MSLSKPLSQVKNLKLRETYRQFECEVDGCKSRVKFVFDGNLACRHHLCGFCLSCSYIPGEKSVVYCKFCAAENGKQVSGILYEHLITTFTKANICTSCFNSKAIYEGRCGHLLCQKCVQDLNEKQTPAECSVRKCSEMHERQDLIDLPIWTIFKFPRFSVCIGTFCKQTAVVVLKQCAHGYCFSCLEKLLEQKTEVGPSNLASVKCHRYFCKIMVPTTSINRFFAKLKDKCFRTAVVLEISPVECSKCEVYDRKNVSKARFRNRFCSNEHSFCIDCIVSSISQSSSTTQCLKNEIADDEQVTCQFNSGCKNTTPVRCFYTIIDVVKYSKAL
ncbi:uncharacterized protein LOC134240119, partial [Saccostrea cucullata]|uniref:uncharacterized protein LOC134240119 n=1 Tax=Saccostrea cuccullata TaxID=36930 RepID=UPI002ED2265D